MNIEIILNENRETLCAFDSDDISGFIEAMKSAEYTVINGDSYKYIKHRVNFDTQKVLVFVEID